ncbi:MAG: 1-deoxy-D-xylulose-5-phosphate reductoisomerase, partial [Thermomicrobiales bacterium]
MPLRLAILGSTGSIGRSTLEVVDAHPDKLQVVALAAGRNAALLREQTARYRPALVSLDVDIASDWRPADTARLTGAEGLLAVATHPDADIVVVATSGHAAIEPTLAAGRAGKVVALANKETIVCAGELVMREVQRAGHRLRPVDSEHSAIWQCLETPRPGAEPQRIILTASGGPFRTSSMEQLRAMTAADARKHPTWKMGSKITIDSATLMNKGLEI